MGMNMVQRAILNRALTDTDRQGQFSSDPQRRLPISFRQVAFLFALLFLTVLAFVVTASGAVVGYLDVDSGAFVSIAFGMQHGAVMYRDLVDHKPPGIEILIWAISSLTNGSIVTIRLVYAAVIAIACVPIALLARQAKGMVAGVIAALLFALDPLRIVLTQNLTQDGLEAAILVWSAYFFATAGKRNKSSEFLYVLAGFFAGIAFLVKQPAALIVVAYAAFLGMVVLRRRILPTLREVLTVLKPFGWTLFGLALAYAPVIVYYWLNGVIYDYYLYVFRVNALSTVSMRSELLEVTNFLARELGSLGAIVAITVTLFRRDSRRHASVVMLMAIWLLIAASFLLFYQMLYSHYLLTIVPQLAVLGGIGLADLFGLVGWIVSELRRERTHDAVQAGRRQHGFSAQSPLAHLLKAGLVIIATSGIGLVSLSVARSEAQSTIRAVSQWQQAPKLAADEVVARKISELTAPGDHIYVLANPAFYALAHRRPSSPYLYYSWRYVQSPIGAQYLAALRHTLADPSTKLVVLADSYRTSIIDPSLFPIIERDYRQVATVPYAYQGTIHLYVRAPLPSSAPVPADPIPRSQLRSQMAWIAPPWTQVSVREDVPMIVRIDNESQVRWPGEGSKPDRAVRIVPYWLDSDNHRVGEGRIPFVGARGFAPGDSVVSRFTVVAPKRPGIYDFVIQLVQENVAWFPQSLKEQITVSPRPWYAGLFPYEDVLFSLEHPGD